MRHKPTVNYYETDGKLSSENKFEVRLDKSRSTPEDQHEFEIDDFDFK